MKHVKYAEKSILVSDDTADTLMEYARLIAEEDAAETVTLQAISPDGNTVDATFLLTSSSEIMVESTNTDLDAPDNAEELRRMRERIEGRTRSASAETEAPWAADEEAEAGRF